MIRGKLLSVEEVISELENNVEKYFYIVSGSESLLGQLPTGNWIGGTTGYFFAEHIGGVSTKEKLLVAKLPYESISEVGFCNAETFTTLTHENNDLLFVIIPAFSKNHENFAKLAPYLHDSTKSRLIGWVSGVLLSEIGLRAAKIFNGATGASSDSDIVFLRLQMPSALKYKIRTINIFTPSSGPVIEFLDSGFEVRDVLINGEVCNFANWCMENGRDIRVPLMGTIGGQLANVSIQNVDMIAGTVSFYAAVFQGIAYRFATPVFNYAKAFNSANAQINSNVLFSCNCILNFQYGDLEGKRLGIVGPITFGEIAGVLHNQTLVLLELDK